MVGQIHFAMAQDIQWAHGVRLKGQAFGATDWAPAQVLGTPNASPYGKLNPKAFRMSAEDGTATLTLSYKTPQIVKQVLIAENNSPGRIQLVTVIDENGNRTQVLENTYKVQENFYVLSVPVRNVLVPIVQVEITLNASGANKAWAQIDAVGISSSDDPSLYRKVLEDLGEWQNFEKEKSKNIKRNLGLRINTTSNENKPIISPDGKVLYFSRQFFSGNKGGSQDYQDIFYSELVNGEWSDAKNIDAPLNNRHPNGVTSVSADGNRLYLINEFTPEGTFSVGFSYADRINGIWQFPKRLEIEGFYNRNLYLDFGLSVNGDVMILAIETNDSYGDQDLYVSFHKGGNQWTTPKNLGPIVNTSQAEFSPFLAADGKTLYFASEGHKGFGGSDIFYTKRLDETWQNWTKPVNLGPNVNTPGFDGYFTISANTDIAYVIGVDGSRAGSRDIYEVKITPDLLPEPIYTLKGKVVDRDSRKVLASDVVIITPQAPDKASSLRSDPINGEFQAILLPLASYSVTVSLPGYKEVITNVGPISSKEDVEVFLEIEMVSLDTEPELPELYPLNIWVINEVNQTILESANFDLLRKNATNPETPTQKSRGEFKYDLLWENSLFVLTASAPGFVPKTIELTLNELESNSSEGLFIVALSPRSSVVVSEKKLYKFPELNPKLPGRINPVPVSSSFSFPVAMDSDINLISSKSIISNSISALKVIASKPKTVQVSATVFLPEPIEEGSSLESFKNIPLPPLALSKLPTQVQLKPVLPFRGWPPMDLDESLMVTLSPQKIIPFANPVLRFNSRPKSVDITESSKPPVYRNLNVYLFDETSGESISGEFSYIPNNNKNREELKSIDETGQLSFEVMEADSLYYTVSAVGYYKKSGFLIWIDQNTEPITEILYLRPIEKDKPVSIPNLLFTQQTSDLLPASFHVLDSMAQVLIDNSSIVIVLSGHTDGIGDHSLNLALSQQRAQSVKNYFIEKGVLPDRILVEAWGGRKPIASNAREETRMLNRRVEITIIQF
jgi:outer membrane protein OmpA-like peptidoglycan-associated protein